MKKIGLIVTGALIFTGSLSLALFLLYDSKLSGAEFVAFVIAFAVVGLVIAFIDEVQEFSLGGNKIKFRELKKEAEKTIAELKTARTETFRFLLSSAKKMPAIFGWKNYDDRIPDFWMLYKMIVDYKCDVELNNEILDTVYDLLFGQQNLFNWKMKGRNSALEGEKILMPSEIEDIVIKNDVIDGIVRSSDNLKEGKTHDDVKKDFEEGLNEYKKLYELKERLERE